MAKRRIEVCRITEPIIRQVTIPYVLQLASPWIQFWVRVPDTQAAPLGCNPLTLIHATLHLAPLFLNTFNSSPICCPVFR